MNLQIRQVNRDFKEMERLEKLNREAFPEYERIPVKKLIELSQHDRMDFSAVYDKERFVGFFVMFYDEKSAYLFFLAIDSAHRSKGYGSGVLQLMKRVYPNRQIVIDIEAAEPSSGNYQQRLTRKNFYLRNGCQETDCLMRYVDADFQVLTLGQSFDVHGFTELLNKIKSSVGMLRGEPFQPEICFHGIKNLV